MLRVTPIYGSHFGAQAEEPVCDLIEWSGCRVLVNIGSTTDTDHDTFPDHDCVLLTDSTLQSLGGLPVYYQFQKSKQETMSDTTTTTKKPPIYATFPTVKMGQMTLYDEHSAICMDGGRPNYSLQDVDDVFASITAIKYSQQKYVAAASDPSRPVLSMTAHRAGHVVGGAFYVLQRLQDETVVVITPGANYHIAKELHLDSSTLLKYAATPDVLITRPGGPAFRRLKALQHGNKKKKPVLPPILVTQAERNLTEAVLSVLRRDGNVLLPVDASGRVLELVLLLNQHWEKERMSSAYNLVWLAPMCQNVTEFARSQLEWMAVNLGTQFDSGSGHPYQLKAVQFCTSLSELNGIMEENQNPVCVLASGLSLEDGPARDVFLKWADNPDNAIIFTDSSQCYLREKNKHHQRRTTFLTAEGSLMLDNISESTLAASGQAAAAAAVPLERAPSVVVAPEEQEGVVTEEGDEGGMLGDALTEETKSLWTTAGQLLLAWAKAKAAGTEMDDSVTVDVNVPVKAPLAGAELKSFLAAEEAARQKLQKEEEKRAMLAQVELAKGQLRLGEDERTTTTTTASAATASAPEPSSSSKTTTAVSTTSSSRPRKKSRFDSTLFLKFSKPLHLTFEVREEAAGIGQPDSTAKYGIGESVGRSGEILEDDYGIAVQPERFTDIVSGVDPSKFAGGSGRIGEEVTRRGFGYGVDNGGRSAKKAANKSSSSRIISEDEDQEEGDEFDEQAMEAVDLSDGHGIIRGRNGRLPTKVSTVPRKVEVLAEVSFVPGLEGRVDARAARQSVRALQPREVVVLGGTRTGKDLEEAEDDDLTDEVKLLAEAATSFATGSKQILSPSDGETVELAVGHAAYGVRLIDTPYFTAEEKEALDGPPEAIEPYEAKLGACTVSVVDCVATGQKVALDDSIVVAPRRHAISEGPTAPSIYLSDGEVLLTDLRAELIAGGMKAEYSTRAGYSQLVVNGKIIVRKEHGEHMGRMSVEGPLCEDFYTVRSIVCGQYVTL